MNEQAQIKNEFSRVEDQASKLRHFLELATLLGFHESFANTLTEKKELRSHKKGTQNTSKGSSFVLKLRAKR